MSYFFLQYHIGDPDEIIDDTPKPAKVRFITVLPGLCFIPGSFSAYGHIRQQRACLW